MGHQGMRFWMVLLTVALVALLTPPALADHTVEDRIEIDVGQEIQLLAGTADSYSLEVDDPAKMLEFKQGPGTALSAKCVRTGPPAIVKIKYRFAGATHTYIITIACRAKERD